MPEALFVILTAYLDESGTHAGSPVTIMAGIMGNARQWQRFQTEIDRLRRKYRFRFFHAKELKSRSGDFQGWPVEKCLALITDLAKLTANGLMEGVTFPLNNTAYEAEYRAGEAPRSARFDSKYGLCFRVCLIHLVVEAMRRANPHKPLSMHFVLESGHKNSGDAERIFYEMAVEIKARGFDLLKTVSFARKEDCDPLLVADFLAHNTFMLEAGSDEQRAHKAKMPVMNGGTPTWRRPEKTGLTHLEFDAGGLAKFRTTFLENLARQRRSNAASRRASKAQPA